MAGDNDVRITVDADNRTTAAFGAAAQGARTVGEATENANRAFREADRRYEAASLRLRQLALSQQAAQERAARLAHEMNDVRTAITAAGFATAEQTQNLQRLTREQDQAATSARILENQQRSSTEQVNDLARAYQRAQRNAQEALRASLMFGAGARLGPDGSISSGSPDGGPGGFRRMLARLPLGLSGLANAGTGTAISGAGNPVGSAALLAGGVGIAALLAPFLGGAVTGAIGAGAGIGGVGAGVAGAWKNDPKAFEAQWADVTGRVTQRWLKASASWVTPLHDAIRQVDVMLRRLPIESILKNSAGYLAPLTKGLTGFGSGLFAGLDSLVKDAKPIIDMLETALPRFGRDLGNFFAALGKGSEGGAEALDDLLYAVGRLTKGLGVTLAALADMYKSIKDTAGAIGDMAGASADWVTNLLDGVPVLNKISDLITNIRKGDGQEEGAPAFALDLNVPQHYFPPDSITGEVAKVPRIFGEATDAIDEFLSKLDEMRDRAAGAANANVALAQGWLDLNKELSEGKRTLDLTTQAGIDNTSALIAQIEAAERARTTQIGLNGDIDAANASYDANIERIRQMAYDLGYNKEQVDELIESLRVIDTTKATPEIEMQGIPKALEDGYSLGNLLNRIERTYYPKVQVEYGPGISLGNALHHAAGGPTSGMSVVNDWGPGTGELIRTPNGSMVIPSGTGRQMMQNLTGGGAGGGNRPVEVRFTGSGALWELFMQAQRTGEVQILSTAIV